MPFQVKTMAEDGMIPVQSAFVKPGERIPQDFGPLVTVIRKNWGTKGVPEGKPDYMDTTPFIGGVAREVPVEAAQGWLDKRRLGVYVLPSDAEESDFIRATGVTPMEPEAFAAMVKAFSYEDLAALLGEKKTLEMAEGLRKTLGLKPGK